MYIRQGGYIATVDASRDPRTLTLIGYSWVVTRVDTPEDTLEVGFDMTLDDAVQHAEASIVELDIERSQHIAQA